MTDSDHNKVLNQFVLGSGPQWTFLGGSESDAMSAIEAARQASNILNSWSNTCSQSAAVGKVLTSRIVEIEPVAAKTKARKINGVGKALSPEYAVMFGALASDFIAVDAGLAAASKAKK